MSAVGTQDGRLSLRNLLFCSLPAESEEFCDEETPQMQRYFLFRSGSDDVKRGGFFLP
jgi:hypothetical protein